MFLKSIHLNNFRNITDQRIDLHPNFNLLIGANAQGKTNVVEAVHLFATGRSFRTSEFRDMLKWNSGGATARTRAVGDMGVDDLRVVMDPKRKEYFRNEKRARPGGKRRFGAVLFAPEEILLLRKAPYDRRRYIDNLVAQVHPEHGTNVKRYGRIITQRNKTLQNFELSSAERSTMVRPWNQQLVETGSRIIHERKVWCDRLNEFIPKKYFSIAPKDDEARLLYEPHCGEDCLVGGASSVADRLTQQLEERREDELRRGVTLVGPGRDDFVAVMGEAPIKHFGSQGQHRTFVLAMKMAEIDFLSKEIEELPVLLLDDVASELDQDRNGFLFEYLRSAKGQVFITATSDKDVNMLADKDVRVFHVNSGRITPRK